MLGLVRTKVPLLELRGVRGLGRLTYKAPFFCPEPHRTVHATKVSVAQADGVPALVGECSCGTFAPCHSMHAVWRQTPLHCCQHGFCDMQYVLATSLSPDWSCADTNSMTGTRRGVRCSLHQPGNT